MCIEEWFKEQVKNGNIPQEPMNYDVMSYKVYVSYLEAENKKLQKQIKKAVELPCKVGDTVYTICPFNDSVNECEVVCVTVGVWGRENNPFFNITVEGNRPLIYLEDGETMKPLDTFLGEDLNKTWFTDPIKAKAKAIELKGENNNGNRD